MARERCWPLGAADFEVTSGWVSSPPPGPAIRYVLSHDGNIHDRDDICALPIGLAIMSATGHASDVVHIEFNNHFWETTDRSQAADMQTSATINTATTWGGFRSGILFDASANLSASLAHLTTVINSATAESPVVILAAGPMQTTGMALAQSNPNANQFVTVISHSSWNDIHAPNYGAREGLSGNRYSFSALGSLGAKLVHIHDQNRNINGTYGAYSWLRDSSDPRLNWLWLRGQVAGNENFDCSDAGMAYYAITGDDNPTPNKVKALLTQ